MTTSKVIVTAHVLTYQLWSQSYSGELNPAYWLYRLQLQTHLVLDPLSTTETHHLPQMYMIHLQRSYCYFHQPLYHLCHCLLTLNGDMLVFEMPDFLGENVHIQKGNVSLDKDDYCPHTDHWVTVVLSCIEYVCYTVHCMEKLKQTVFLKKLVDGRYYILNSQKMYQPLPKSWKHNNFNVGKKSCTGVGVN